MPRLDNPDIKLKKVKTFRRKKARPWDDPISFLPTKILNEKVEASNKHNSTELTLSTQTNHSAKGNKITNGKQLDNDWISNGKQLDIASDNNKISNSKQLDNDWISNGKQLDIALDNNRITTIKKTIEKASQEIKPQNIGYNKTLKTIKKLFGLQKKAFLFIINSCHSTGTLCSTQITNEALRKTLNTDIYSVKTTIHRLVKKGLLSRLEGKKGVGGYTLFSINESILDAATELNRQDKFYDQTNEPINQSKLAIGKQLDIELDNNRVTTRISNSHIVSSSYNTTTNIPEEFQQIDCSPLSHIGFDESHIIQIHREHKKNPELALSVDIIQNSINSFAFDLKHNDVASTFKSSPAVVLTSLLKRGQPYSSKTPEKVLTPQEEAMQEYLLAQEKRQQKIAEIKIKARDLALQEWLDSLSTEQILEFNQEPRPDGLPDKVYQSSRRKKAVDFAKDYFDTVLWPDKLKQILATNE